MILSLIVGFLLGAAAIVFALQNTTVVALTFLGWQFESSLALLILIAAATGALVALLVILPSVIGDGFRIGKLQKENKKLVRELEAEKETARTIVVEEPSQVLDIREA